VRLCLTFTLLFLLVSCRQALPKSESPRYVITSPEAAEIVYLLQGIKNVVGVAEEVDYPAPFRELPKVGSFGGITFEKIIELNPSLVITASLEQERLAGELQKIGIETLVIYPQSIDEMLESIVIIAEKIGIRDRGVAVRDSLKTELNSLVEKVPTTNKPRVYVEIYGNPIMSVSNKSYVGRLVNIAGGDNIFTELPRDYSRVKQEDVINYNPDIIIITYPGVTAKDVINRKGWQHLSACKENRIYHDINPDLILRAGPRFLEGISVLQSLFNSFDNIDK